MCVRAICRAVFDVCRKPTSAGHNELHSLAPESGGGVGPPAASATRAALRVRPLSARARPPAEARAGLQPAWWVLCEHTSTNTVALCVLCNG